MKEELESLMAKNAISINTHYQKGEDISLAIVEEVVKTILEESLLDASRLSFIEYSKKYLSNVTFFDYRDFTSTEIKEIIGETPLTERDRHIAALRYIELKSEEEIAEKLYIDKKTVHSNIPKISYQLKRTATRLYKK